MKKGLKTLAIGCGCDIQGHARDGGIREEMEKGSFRWGKGLFFC